MTAKTGETTPAALTLWGRATSVNVQKPMWLMAEIGVEYERIDVGGPFGGLDSAEFTALSPHGQIPVLVDRRFGPPIVVWESAAVMRHLAEAGGRAGFAAATQLWPQQLAARATIDRWAEWAQANWYPAIATLFVGIVRAPAPERKLDALKTAAETAGRLAQTIDAALGQSGGFLAGPALTLADFPFAALLHRYMTLEIGRPETPMLSRYYETLKTRAPYAEVIAVDYDPMRVPGAERSATPIV
ncbi:MAG: glutathione S-transferase family protein [Neomegalonema sp.]|nr:glutathione S-transferase family protein [Neomegalonema sp.]